LTGRSFQSPKPIIQGGKWCSKCTRHAKNIIHTCFKGEQSRGKCARCAVRVGQGVL